MFSELELQHYRTLSRFGASALFSTAYGSELGADAGFSLAGWERLAEIGQAGTPGAYLVVSIL
jgi:hypothetical protein